MTFRNWHKLLGTVFAAAVAGISGSVQALIYPIEWDPQFGGVVFVDLVNDPGCKALGDGIWDTTLFPQCKVNFVAPFDIFDLNVPAVHFTTAAGLPVADVATFVEIFGGQFNQFDTNVVLLQEIGCEGDCSAATIQFFIGEDPSVPFPGNATLTINGQDLFNAYKVPEPGALGLLLGAMGAGWLTRRRNTAA
jgi:hypothetical protein